MRRCTTGYEQLLACSKGLPTLGTNAAVCAIAAAAAQSASALFLYHDGPKAPTYVWLDHLWAPLQLCARLQLRLLRAQARQTWTKTATSPTCVRLDHLQAPAQQRVQLPLRGQGRQGVRLTERPLPQRRVALPHEELRAARAQRLQQACRRLLQSSVNCTSTGLGGP